MQAAGTAAREGLQVSRLGKLKGNAALAEAGENESVQAVAEAHDATMPRAVDAAYRGIRKAIISGDLRSGERVSESALAARLGVSRTPVREALNRLRTEGLIVLERYRKGYVASFTADDLREIFRLRAMLEGEAARAAALLIGAEELARVWMRCRTRWSNATKPSVTMSPSKPSTG